MEPARKRPTVSATDAGVVLPPDLLWEILLRVPAGPLSLFRAVCRLWRSLLSDPLFIKAHAALRPDLILALAGDNDRIDMMDLSGNVVRRMSITPEDVGVLHHHAHPGPFYLLQDNNRVRMVDPDTGAASTLPFDDLQRSVESAFEGSYALGWVASTGQHKVLRVLSYPGPGRGRIRQHYDVFTLGDDRWRPVAGAPPLCAMFKNAYHHVVAHNAVIQGVVYFLPHTTYPSFDMLGADNAAIDTNCIMSFDLEAEEWGPATLPGPPPAIDNTGEFDCQLKLAKLYGRLVMLCYFHDINDNTTIKIDLWFATDLEKGVWVKEHSIRLELLPVSNHWLFAPVQLLRVLDDGRVVFYYSGNSSSGNWRWPTDWRIRIYDPRTKSYTEVPQHGIRYIAGMYRGSMLCLGSRD